MIMDEMIQWECIDRCTVTKENGFCFMKSIRSIKAQDWTEFQRTFLYRNNIWRVEVWQLEHVQWMNDVITNRFWWYHHWDNRFELVNKWIHPFSLEWNEVIFFFVMIQMRKSTFSIETFCEKNRVCISEVVNQLVNINLNRIDWIGHSRHQHEERIFYLKLKYWSSSIETKTKISNYCIVNKERWERQDNEKIRWNNEMV